MTKSQTSIHSLIGEELSAVCFVRDYVEFCFDGPILRAINNPTISVSKVSTTFPSAGSYDMFCTLIGQRLIKLNIKENVEAVFEFSSGAKLIIPLIPEINTGEAMHFLWSPDAPLQVW